MSLVKAFGTDKSLERDGVWVDLCVNDDESLCRFRIARMGPGNRNFSRRAAALQKKFRGKLNAIPSDKERRLIVEAFVDTVLIGWENVVEFRTDKMDPDGEITFMEFNKENATFVLYELRDLMDMLVAEATTLENFQSEANAVEAGN